MRKAYVHADVFDINLLREPPRRHALSAATLLLAVLLTVTSAATGWLWRDAERREQAALEQFSRVDRQLLELKAKNRTVTDAEGAEALLAAVDGLVQFRPSAVGLMERLNRILPAEARLQSLVYSGGHVQLVADFATAEHVVAFLREIERSKDFTLISLGTLNNRPVGLEEQDGFGAAGDGFGTSAFSAGEDVPELAPDSHVFIPSADVAAPSERKPGDLPERLYLPVTGLAAELSWQPADGHTGAPGQGEDEAE